MKYFNLKTITSVIAGVILARVIFKYTYESDVPILGGLWEF